jgi:hypothetical protein
MPRVVPSQVVDLIDKLFPTARAEQPGNPMRLNFDNLAAVTPLVRLLEQIPSELLVMDATQYAEYVSSVAALNSHIRVWETRGNTQPLTLIPGLRRHSPIALIRQALERCPNEFPPASTSELTFISDEKLRERLNLDIGAVENAFSNSEWKAATVLAGSLIEALLLWVLEEQFSDKVESSVDRLVTKKVFRKKPDDDPQWWDLYHYVEVAADLTALDDDTVTLVRLAKDYRNFIHPGKAKRLQQDCNRSTAMTAIAALYRVTRDLAKKFAPAREF